MRNNIGGVFKQVEDPLKLGGIYQPAARQMNILIVEDDPLSQKLLELILKDTGYPVKFVDNGLDAVQMVKSHEFGLVLMDIQMPLMDGLEATRRIRAWEKGETHITIIGLTAIIDSAYTNCLQAGMDDIISKPFDNKKLQAIIRERMGLKKIVTEKTTDAQDRQKDEYPILDVQGAVKRFAGDQENYADLLKEFTLSLPEKFDELLTAYKTGNWQTISSRAHNLKGLSASFGAMDLSRKYHELDQLVNGTEYGRIIQKLDEINICIQNLKTETLTFFKEISNVQGKLN